MTKDEFINYNLTYMGDLSKVFSRYEVSYSCTSNASWISPIFIEKNKNGGHMSSFINIKWHLHLTLTFGFS